MKRRAKPAISLIKKVRDLKIWKRYSVAEWILFVVGILTIIFIFINLFTHLNQHEPTPSVDAGISLSEPKRFLATIASGVNSSVEQGSPITILTNGQEFLPDLLAEIAHAKRSIYITDYIWDGGTFGNTLLTALTKKAAEGVEVRVLLDGTAGTPTQDLVKKLKQAGGKVESFRPVTWSNLTRIDRRTHVRDFVIDNTAYVGGIAVSDLWLGDATSSEQWHDYMFKSSGAYALRSSAVFANMWGQTTGETLSTQEAPTATPTSEGKFVALFSQPSPDLSTNLEHFLWLSIKAATSSIYIESPYLLPPQSIQKALEEKARAGVNVVLIVPSDKTDSQNTRLASQTFYSSLLQSGVKIFEYQPSRFHSKVALFDGVWSIVGSANLDNRSATLNLEYVVGVFDQKLGQDLAKKIAIDQQHSKEVTLEEWKHSSYAGSLLQQLSRLFIEQY